MRNQTDQSFVHFLHPVLYFSNVTNDENESMVRINETASICEPGKQRAKQLNQIRSLHVIAYYQSTPDMNFVNRSLVNEAAICLQHYVDICLSSSDKWCEKI